MFPPWILCKNWSWVRLVRTDWQNRNSRLQTSILKFIKNRFNITYILYLVTSYSCTFIINLKIKLNNFANLIKKLKKYFCTEKKCRIRFNWLHSISPLLSKHYSLIARAHVCLIGMDKCLVILLGTINNN